MKEQYCCCFSDMDVTDDEDQLPRPTIRNIMGEPGKLDVTPPTFLFTATPISASNDHDGNHSSEEELEEINKEGVPVSSSGSLITPSGSPSGSTSSNSVSSLSSSGCDGSVRNSTPITGHSDTPICGNADTPVEFSTSPPTGMHVHKPRRSLSPPGNVFSNADSSADSAHIADNQPSNSSAQHTWPTVVKIVESSKLWCPIPVLPEPPTVSTHTPFSRHAEIRAEERRERRAISPKKRYRHQHRIHHLQRPCLDFEKMQQVSKGQYTQENDASLCWRVKNGISSTSPFTNLFDFMREGNPIFLHVRNGLYWHFCTVVRRQRNAALAPHRV